MQGLPMHIYWSRSFEALSILFSAMPTKSGTKIISSMHTLNLGQAGANGSQCFAEAGVWGRDEGILRLHKKPAYMKTTVDESGGGLSISYKQ